MEKKLWVFDFDGTIVLGHTHNTIMKSQNPDDPVYVNGPWGKVENFPNIGSADTWKDLFETLNQQGHYLCIASFNAYGSVIPEFLNKIGLTEKVIGRINIIFGLPDDPRTADKNEYIQQAIAKAQKEGFSGNAEDVILIDDSTKNIQAAEEKRYRVIRAKKDASHLTELKKEIQKQKIESLKRQKKEALDAIYKLVQESPQSLSLPQQQTPISKLKSKLSKIESEILKEQADLENLAGPTVDQSNKPKHLESASQLSSEEQDAVPTKITQAQQASVKLPTVDRSNKSKYLESASQMSSEEQDAVSTKVKQAQQASVKFSAVDRFNNPRHMESSSERGQGVNLNEPQKAKSEKLQQQTLFGGGLKKEFINELETKLQITKNEQGVKCKFKSSLSNQSTLFLLNKSSTSSDNKKMQEIEKKSNKQFSR